MRYRKCLSFIFSIVLVVVSIFSVSLADASESGRSYTLPSGITLTIPQEFKDVLWPGIEEDDPLLDEYELDKEMVMELYTSGGIELQCTQDLGDNGPSITFAVFEMDAPEDMDIGNIQPMGPDLFETPEILACGMVERAGIPLYKIAHKNSGEEDGTEYVLKGNQYSLITGSGKMHQFCMVMTSELKDGMDAENPFTVEECRQFDEISESIMSSISLSDELASDIVTPEGAEAFPEEEVQSYTTTSGITLTVPEMPGGHAVWTGMEEDDPILEELGIDKDAVMSWYEQGGLEFQKMTVIDEPGGCYLEIIVFEMDVPSDINARFADQIQPMSPGSFETTDFFEYGMVKRGGSPFYKIAFQTSGETVLRLNQYSLITGSGKMHQINFFLLSDPEIKTDPYTDEQCRQLEEISESVMRSIKLSDELASDAITPEGVEPFEGETEDTPGSQEETPAAVPEKSSTVKRTSTSFFKTFTTFKIPTYFILIALALLLLLGLKPSKLREWQEEPLSLDKSKAIQGFAAVAIIVHHLSQELAQQAGAIRIFENLGVLFVGIFFFFSGYGLYTSLKTKENYLKGFLKKRLVTILIPFYMCILIFTVAAFICGRKFKTMELLYTLSGWSLINQHMWYIVEVAILYLAFFLIYRLIKNRTVATVVMGIFVIAMMTGSLLLAHGKDMSCSYWFQGEWWYNSSFLFVIGILFSKHADGLRKIARKGYIILLPVFAALTALLGMQNMHMLKKYSYWSEIPGQDPAYLDKLRCLSVQLPWIIVFVCFLLLLMMKIRFGNPVLKFLGSISLELYLIHNLFLEGLRNGTIFKVASPGMYCVLTILMAVGFATIISGVDKYLIALITGKKKTLEEPSLKTSSHIHSIDVMRIVMAFLVVAIHLPFDGKAGSVFITYGKTAVPFFLVICGYFLYRDDIREMRKRLVKQTKRILIFFIASNVFYAVFYAIYLRVTEGSFKGVKECFTSKALQKFLLYNFSPFSEHLWYLGSLLYALVILLVLNKLRFVKQVMYTAPFLVAGYVVLSHLGIGEGYQLRNAILVGLGYTMMGMLIRRFEKKILDHKATAPVLWIVFAICCVTAIFELNHYKKGIAVPFVSCEILVYVIALLCLKYPDFGKDTFAEWLGRECSLTVYILHISVWLLMVMTQNDRFFGKYGAVTVFVITTVIAALYKSIKNAITDKKETVTDKKQTATAQQ